MSCQIYKIKELNVPGPIAIASPDHFSLEPCGQIDLAEVYRDPKYSLYCFDPLKQTALFLESSDPALVDQAPFYYQGQRATAVRAVEAPLEQFHRFAAEMGEPQRVIFVHSVGRCGSTLVSKILQAIPEIHSLSEPDDLTQLGNLRLSGAFSDDEVGELLTSSIRWRLKPRIGEPSNYVAIKPRSEVMTLADLLGPRFPDAKHLFLYRNGLSWMKTIFRGVAPERDIYDDDRNREMETSWGKTLPLVRELRNDEKPMNLVQVRILGWASCMEGYLKLRELPIATAAIRFEDLTQEPEPMIAKMFDFLEIDCPNWDAIREVLSKDSQAGTIYDREERKKRNREMTEDLIQDLYAMIERRPLLKSPDFIAPGTFEK